MKTIILISSFFYIIGLKIGNNIDLSPKCVPVKKIITNKISAKTTDKSYNLETESADVQSKTDTLKTTKKEKVLTDNKSK